MLLVRVLDGQRDRREVLVFVLADNGELGALSGEIGLIDLDEPLADASGEPVTRARPGPWLDALDRRLTAEGRYALEASPLRSPPSPRSTTRGRRLRLVPVLGVIALLCLVGAAVGGWRSHWFGLAPVHHRGAAPLRSLASAHHDSAGAPGKIEVHARSRGQRRLAHATTAAVDEMLGEGDSSPVAFDPSTGLWDFALGPGAAPSPTGRMPTWWQSGTAMDALVRFAQAERSDSASVQRLLQTIYSKNVSKPGTFAADDFENQYMDDTGWWGLAWVDAARYELTVRHDRAQAGAYLKVAEADAAYIGRQHSRCGTHAIPFRPGWPPNTITDTEFIDLTARLGRLRSAGSALADPALARRWRADALGTLSWLERSGLIDIHTGRVTRGDSGGCRPAGPAQLYTQGEVADAFTEVGALTHDPLDTEVASTFIRRVTSGRSGLTAGGVVQNPCQSQASLCAGQSYNITIFGGLFDEAVSDWGQITGSHAYHAFLATQANAVLANATGLTTGACTTAAKCQLSMYWSRRVPQGSAPMPPDVGSQAGGVAAFTGALSAGVS